MQDDKERSADTRDRRAQRPWWLISVPVVAVGLAVAMWVGIGGWYSFPALLLGQRSVLFGLFVIVFVCLLGGMGTRRALTGLRYILTGSRRGANGVTCALDVCSCTLIGVASAGLCISLARGMKACNQGLDTESWFTAMVSWSLTPLLDAALVGAVVLVLRERLKAAQRDLRS